MLLNIVRAFYLLLVLAFTIPAAFGPISGLGSQTYVVLTILVPLALALSLVVADIFWRQKRLQALTGLFFGILAGLAIAYVLAQTVDLVSRVYVEPAADFSDSSATLTAATAVAPAVTSNYSVFIRLLKAFLGASAVYMCVSFILQTKDDFRFIIPYVEFSKQIKGARPILLDTSVVVDGRIADIAETGVLESDIIVPRFILAELQTIADSDDKLKRARGRRGLDILSRLQGNKCVNIRILDVNVPSVEEAPQVDAKLVALAKHLDGRIVTNDYNLNKIAQLRGVDVVNVNDLAKALKPVVLPGEPLSVKILKQGEESGQGVGYLEDGTMVVAEGGKDFLNKDVSITVTSVLQTSAGRMIFGRVEIDAGLKKR